MPTPTDPAAETPSPASASPVSEASPSLAGLLSALCAFTFWGVLPLYWKALDTVDSFEIMCHRIVWSFFTLLPFMFFQGRFVLVLTFLKSKTNALTLLGSSCILAGNWYLYIWAINTGRVLEASLGYFINPLVNILFGIIIFKEKSSRMVQLAIALAALGVAYQIIVLGQVPIVPLALAIAFGLYGLIRKILQLPSLPGLFMETLFVMPFAGAYIFWQWRLGNSPIFTGDISLNLLLMGTGLITSFPLLCFAYGAMRIRMSTLGLLQYTNPTIVFLLGIFLYHEPFSVDSLITFACIWAALALYTWETIRQRRW
jgi:chloramphenicol-sensitive protein RarD